jgi:hypothetical protein
MIKKIFKYLTRKNRRGYAIYDSRNMFYQVYLYFLHKSSSKNLSRNEKIKNSYRGKRCFIFFTGTSTKDFNFDIIKGEFVVGSGMSFIHKDFEKCNVISYFNPGPWEPRSLMTLDFLYSSIYKKTKNGCHIMLDATAYPYREEIRSYRDVDTYFIASDGNYLSSKDIKSELHELNNIQDGSLSLGLGIANYLGFNEIYLLGQDYMSDPAIYGHFYDGFYDIGNPNDYQSYRERGALMIEHLKKNGARVINVVKDNNQKSAIDSITFKELEYLLG